VVHPGESVKDDTLPADRDSSGQDDFQKGMVLFYEEHRFRDAIEYFDQAEAQGYTDPKLFFNRGWACHEERVHFEGCSFEQAIQDFARAIELDPGNAQFYDYRAWSYVHLEMYDEAFQDYARAIELEPSNSEIWAHQAKALNRTGDLGASLESINEAIDLNPDNANYYGTRASIYRRLGEEPREIEKDLLKAIELDPDNWEVHLALAELYTYELGDIDLGHRHFDLAVERAPKDAPEPVMARGMFFIHIEAWNQAVKDLSLTIRLRPNFPDGYGHRGHAFQQMGRFDEAREDYLAFLELSQGMPEYDGWRHEIEMWLVENP
jgi:tetratricopeptide (TPR) repeat protein